MRIQGKVSVAGRSVWSVKIIEMGYKEKRVSNLLSILAKYLKVKWNYDIYLRK